MESNKRICIYTAIYGGYDQLLPQAPQDLECDFICFTDDTNLVSDQWQVIYFPLVSIEHPRMQAKFPKILPHKIGVLNKYTHTIWIDGCIQITRPDFARYFLSFIGKYGWSMLKHPDRDCIYDEVNYCWHFQKYIKHPLREQVEHYRKSGYPEHNGLQACTIIARDMSVKKVQLVCNEWWMENVRWTYQDQLSLPYVLWKQLWDYDVNPQIWCNHTCEYYIRKDHANGD